MAREISLFEHKLASLTEELASGVLGPVAAHAILVGGWVAPPVILLGSSIASTWDALGPIGATLLGGTVTGGLVGGRVSRSLEEGFGVGGGDVGNQTWRQDGAFGSSEAGEVGRRSATRPLPTRSKHWRRRSKQNLKG